MRRIEEKMLDAIRGGYDWHESNTEVTHLDNNVVRVRLYGNLIAKCDPVNGWRFSLAGYNTNTTRSRLNALGCNVYQKNFTPMRDGREWWSDF